MAEVFRAYRGDAYHRECTFRDVQGNPLDLTGYTIKWTLRDTVEGTQLLQKTGTEGGATDGITYPDALNGRADLDIPAGDTDLMALNVSVNSQGVATEQAPYFWDFELTAPGGDVQTLPRGTDAEAKPELGQFFLYPEITRP